MKEVNKCSTTVNNNTSREIVQNMINRYSDEKCGCNAKYFEGDEWFCGKHAPSKIKERETKSYEKWVAKNKNKKMEAFDPNKDGVDY